MNQMIMQKALAEINRRRIQGEVEMMERDEEVSRLSPEFAAIRRELAATSVRLGKLIMSAPGNMEELLNKMAEENLSLQQREAELLLHYSLPADYLQRKYYCEKCKDTGFTDEGRCSCLLELARRMSAEEFQKNTALQLTGFEDFSLDYYSSEVDPDYRVVPKKIMADILDFCRKYAAGFTPGVKGILMQGDTGLGKTHLSLAIAAQVAEKGAVVLYDSAQNLLRQIEGEHFGRMEQKGTLDAALNADLLILDDLGTEFASQFTLSMIYDILNTRFSQNRTTIVSTNLTARELEEKYSRRIVSRLYSCLTCLRFVGKDVRQQKSRLY